jgi:hypothetical protein
MEKDSENLNSIAEKYVILVHQIGKYDPDYVDSYFGPDSLEQIAKNDTSSLRTLKLMAISLAQELDSIKLNLKFDLVQELRYKFLKRMFEAMNYKINMLLGYNGTFDQECEALYGATSPVYPLEFYQEIIDNLNDLLPGTGDIKARYKSFKDMFIIPEDKVDLVFKTALDEAKKRTKANIEMPNYEDFQLEYVRDKAWSGYNWYKGNGFSLIQINLDLPIYIERAIDLAAHEAYPGHHTHHALMEETYVKDSNWVEFTIYPLFSPMSLISEGTANYGIEVAFPGEEKLKFEREVLYPLAGINPELAEKYNSIQSLISKLDYVGNDAARMFLDGEFNEEQTIDYLVKYNLMTEERAKQRLNFIKKYRAYVINYNVGLDMVREFVLSNGGTEDNPKKRWLIFEDLIRNPYLPSDIKIDIEETKN